MISGTSKIWTTLRMKLFPAKFLHGSDRPLHFHWLVEYQFLVYSKIISSDFKKIFEKPSSPLTYGYENQRIESVQHIREILKWVAKTNESCVKQNIVYRGHRGKVASNENNCGNFLATLKLIAPTNDTNKQATKKCLLKVMKSFAPTIILNNTKVLACQKKFCLFEDIKLSFNEHNPKKISKCNRIIGLMKRLSLIILR